MVDLRWAGPILCAIAFVGMAAWSWRKWPDPLIDFGRELYVPWQISQGKVLYRDIAALFGPFSQYLNALFFWLFGVSLTTLIFCNLAILAGATCLIYRLLAEACDRLTATAACLVFLLVFAFAQYMICGNYNYVCPYAHEATHGVMQNVAMIYCLSRAARRPYLMCGLAGLCFGLAMLTKTETALAAVVVLLTWAAMAGLARPAVMPFGWRPVLVLAGAALAPMAAFFAYFCTQMPASQALGGIATPWRLLMLTDVAENVFYRTRMGLDDVRGNIVMMLRMSAGLALAVMAAAAADVASRRRRRIRVSLAIILAVGLLIVLTHKPAPVSWDAVARTWPIAAALIWVGCAAAMVMRRTDRSAGKRMLPLVLWGAFSCVMLGKMILNVELAHYGFVLAMPATLLLVVGLMWLIPGLLSESPGMAVIFRGAALAAIGAGVFSYVEISRSAYQNKDLVVGRGGDVMLAFRPSTYTGGLAATALQEIERLAPSGETMAVLPEGVILNYLSRRSNPTPYTSFMPPEVLTFGEDAMLASLVRQPPGFIVVVHRDTSEYGFGLFGQDPRYGKKIMDWVNSSYESAAVIGWNPLQDAGQFGVKIMRRRAGVTSTTMPAEG